MYTRFVEGSVNSKYLYTWYETMYSVVLHHLYAQTHRSTGDERVPLDEPHKLTRKHFEQVLDVDTALALVTLTPLYPCINTSKRS